MQGNDYSRDTKIGVPPQPVVDMAAGAPLNLRDILRKSRIIYEFGSNGK